MNRRKFVKTAGAGLLLSPYLSLLEGRSTQAAGKKVKRLMLFCSMGTSPSIWTPTNVSSETSFTFSASTEPLAKIKQHLVLIEGLSSGNPGNNHGAPDALTGVGHGGRPMLSVDQFIADKLKGMPNARPIPSLLLGADSRAGGGRTMFNRNDNLATIASPMTAFNTVFGGALPTGTAPDKILKRKKSILDILKADTAALQKQVGAQEKAKLELHLDSLRQLEKRLAGGGSAGMPAAMCKAPGAPAGDFSNPIKANISHLDVAIGAFACDITRVAAVQFGSDQTMAVDIPEIGLQGDQHGGFIHSGAPDFKNLVKLERWLCDRFVETVEKLKAIPEADGTGSLFDNTLLVWCRDMGDAPAHSQRNMRFVLAGGAAGYLKTAPTGRYIKGPGDGAADRHERVLLAMCDALGITSFSGFGDSKLTGADKTPIAGLSA